MSAKKWNPRKKRGEIGRVVYAKPTDAERYYLRMLLNHVKGPTSFEDLSTVDGITHSSFRAAAEAMGLIEKDDSISECLSEAATFQFPSALRRLFATILTFCVGINARELWDKHFADMSEDYWRDCASDELVQQMTLRDVSKYHESLGKSLEKYALPELDANAEYDNGNFQEVSDEVSIEVSEDDLSACSSLNPEQLSAFNEIMKHATEMKPWAFFIDGPWWYGHNISI